MSTEEKLVGIFSKMFAQSVSFVKDNPELAKQLNESFLKVQNENEELKIELKSKQSTIDYLRGKISVYESIARNSL